MSSLTETVYFLYKLFIPNANYIIFQSLNSASHPIKIHKPPSLNKIQTCILFNDLHKQIH